MSFFTSINDKIKQQQQTQAQQTQGLPSVQKTAYQQNLSTPAPQKWYQGEYPTSMELYGRIYSLNKTDPAAAAQLNARFMQEQQTKGSNWYAPYSQPTNPAVSILQSYGIDTSTLTSDWFAKNTGWQNYLQYGTTTTTPKVPGKNASENEIIAYQLYQYQRNEKDTEETEDQLKALQQEIAYKASRTDRNYSDDYIVNSIDWNKYPKLKSMRESVSSPALIELNRAIDVSDDNLHGMIWAARNGSSGNYQKDIAMSALGEGKTWQENPELSSMLDWNNKDTFSIYQAGMTLDEEVAMYFNRYSFDQQAIDDIRKTLDPNDATATKMFGKLVDAWNNTQKGDAERDALYDQVDKWIAKGYSEKKIQEKLDEIFNNENPDLQVPTLKKMDDSIKDGSATIQSCPVQTTRAIDFSRNSLNDYIHNQLQKEDEKSDAAGVTEKVTGEPVPKDVKQEEVDAVTGAASPNFTETELANEDQAKEDYKAVAPVIAEKGTDEERTALQGGKTSLFNKAFEQIVNAKADYAKKLESSVGEIMRGSYIDSMRVGYDYESHQKNRDSLQGQLDEVSKEYDALSERYKKIRTVSEASTEEYSTILNLAKRTGDETWDYYRGILEEGPEDLDTYGQEQYERALLYVYQQSHPGDYGSDMDIILPKAQELWNLYQAVNSEGDLTSMTQEEYERTEILGQKVQELKEGIAQEDAYLKENQDAYNKSNRDKIMLTMAAGAMGVLSKVAGGESYQNLIQSMGDIFELTQQPPDPNTTYLPYSYFDMYAENGQLTKEQAATMSTQYATDAATSVEQLDKVIEEMDKAGIQLSDEEKKNLQKNRDNLDYQAKSMAYAGLNANEDFAQKAEEGKKKAESGDSGKIAKAVATGNWNLDVIDWVLGMLGGTSNTEIFEKSDMESMLQSITEDEKNRFFYLLENDGQKAAEDYFKFIADPDRGELTIRASGDIAERVSEFAGQNIFTAGLSTLSSFIGKQIGTARSTAYRIGNAITGGEATAYNPAYWENNAATGARQGSKTWLKSVFGENEITDRIYDVLTGIGDITLTTKEMKALGALFEGTKLASGLSKVAESVGNIKGGKLIVSGIKDAASILPLSIEASNNTYQKVFAQTKDADKAEQMAGISFVADIVSHTVIMKGMQKAFKANPDQFASKLTTFIEQSVSNAGVAGASTFFTEGFQQRAEKAILGEMSDWGQTYAKYEAQGYPKSMCEQLTEQEMNKRIWQKVIDSEINAVIRTGAVTIAREFQNRGGFRELWNETKRTAGAAKNAAVRGINQLFPEKGEDIVIDASEGQILDAEGNPVEQGIYGYLPGTGEAETSYPEGTDKTLSIINGISGASNTGAAVGTAAVINSGDPNTDKAVGQQMVVLANGDTKTLAAALQQMVLTTPNPMALNNDLVISSLVKGSGNQALQTIIEKVGNGEVITTEDMTALHNGASQDRAADKEGASIIQAVKMNRIANRTNEIVAGQRKIIEAAEQKKEDAKVSLAQAKKNQEIVEGEREAAAESVRQAVAEQMGDASNDDHNGAVQQTVNHLVGKDDQAINQAAASVANAEQRMAEATQNAERTTGEVISSAREQATAEVEEQMAQEQQQRDEQQLAKQAEADRLALQNEQEAKQEEESRKQYETKFRTALTKKGFTGESLEKNVQKAVELAMQRERGKIDTSKRLSEEDGDAFLRQVSRQTGMRFSMQDMGDPNVIRGVNKGGSEIILNSRLSKGQALTEAALHETIHGLEQTSVYNQFADTVLSILYGGRGTEAYNKAIQEKVREYGTLGIALSSGQPGEEDNGAEREIVADFARLNMANKKFIRKIVARGAGKEYHKAVSSARNILNGYRLTGKAKQTANMMRRAEAQVLAAIDEASRMKQEAYDNHTGMNQFSVTSAGNAVGLTIEPNDNGTYQYKIIRKNGDNSEVVAPGSFTADDVKGTPAGKLIDMRGQLLKKQFDNGELTKEQYDQQLAAYEKAAPQMRQFMADIINLIGESQDAELVWELAGSQAFSTLKANGDKAYGTSEDMGSICVKTRNIINVMSDVMLKLKRGLTKDEIDNIVYKEVARGVQDENGNWKAGVVPCPPCYVFSRWVNRPARIEKVNQFQKECKDWTDEQIQELMDTPEPVGRTKAETIKLSTELKQKKLWVSLCLADKHTDPKTKEVTWTRRENPDICPDEILFDLNRSGDMAVQHPGTWKFMQKGGTQMGKAISPYADSRIGESIIGIKTSAAHEKDLLEDAQNKGKPGYKQKFHNPFEFNKEGDEKQAFEDYEGAVKEIKKQNAKGGQRWQSWGDFRAEWGSDYLMEMMTMQMLGATVQTYTKVPQAIDLFATANFEVNMSLMPDGDGFEHNKDGSIKTDYLGRKVLKFSGVTGIDPKAAYEYTMKYGKKGNVHPMIVGISDDHILACLESDYIGYVIPFHGSGGSVDRLQHLMNQVGQNMDSGFDYTAAQEEKFLKTAEVTDPKTGKKKTINPNPVWNLRKAIITGEYDSLTEAQKQAIEDNEFLKKLYEDRYLKEDSKLYQVFFTDDEADKIYPYEYWETEIQNPDGTTRPATMAEADNNGERYVRYCQMMDVEPKFSGLVKKPPNGRNYFTEEEVAGKENVIRDKQGRPIGIAYGNFSGKTVDEKTGEVTYKPVKGYYKVLIDHPMYNRIYDSNGNLIKEKSVYREPEAVDVSNIQVGAVPQAVNEYPEVSDPERAEITDRIAKIIYARKKGQDEEEVDQAPANGRTMLAYNAPMQQSEEATTTGEYVEQQKPKAMAIDPDEQASAGGEMTDAELDAFIDEMDDEKYLSAVDSGDRQAQQDIIDYQARKNGFTTEDAFHGTESFGFTEFDMQMSQGQIFVAFDKSVSDTYSKNADVREVHTAEKPKDYFDMSGEEIAEEYYERNKGRLVKKKENVFYIAPDKIDQHIDENIFKYLSLFPDEFLEGQISYQDFVEFVKNEGYDYGIFMEHDFDSPREIAEYLVESMANSEYEGSSSFEYPLYICASMYGITDIKGDGPTSYVEEAYRKKEELSENLYRSFWLKQNPHISTHDGIVGIIHLDNPVQYMSTGTVRQNLRLSDKSQIGTYRFYTRPGKQLVVDADDANWNRIPWSAMIDADPNAEGDHESDHWTKTREVAKWAKQHGYDSVRINNVYDHGGRGSGFGHGDIGIFFNQKDVKSADPITYDDQGKPVLPTERFSDKSDFRWSAGGELSAEEIDRFLDETIGELSADEVLEFLGISTGFEKKESKPNSIIADAPKPVWDAAKANADYLLAVKEDDMGKAQQLVDEKAKEYGYTVRGTHRTNAEFTVFEKSKRSGKNGKTLGDGFYVAAGEGTEYDNDIYGKNRMLVYLKPGRVFKLSEGLTEKQAREVYDKYFAPYHPNAWEGYTSHVLEKLQSPTRVIDYIKEAADNAGTTTDEVFKSLGYDSIKDGPQYCVFDPEQIKSADPVTYDDNGEPILLAKRFLDDPNDSHYPDTRYSIGGEMSEEELLNLMVEEGMMSPDEIPYSVSTNVSSGDGMKRRQFGSQTAQKSDALHDEVKRRLYQTSFYKPKKNDEQIDLAIDWARSHATENDPDGYHGVVKEVLDPNFKYWGAEGQAKMLTAMSMAAIKADAGDPRALEDELAIAQAFDRQGTDAGQTLQFRKVFELMTPVGKQRTLEGEVERVNQELARKGSKTRVKIDKSIIDEAAEAKTESEFRKVQRKLRDSINEQIPVNWGERILAWRMFSMLSAPTTHIRNIAGNAIFIPMVMQKNKIAAVNELVAQATGLIDKSERTKTLKPVTSKENRAFARKIAKDYKPVLRGEERGEGKYKEGDQRQRERKVFGTKNGIWSKTIGKALQKAYEGVGKALEAEDWFFLKGHFRRALTGLMDARGLKPEDMTDEMIEEAAAYCVNEATRATYRDFSAVAKALGNLGNQYKGDKKVVTTGLDMLQFIVDARLPFKSTPLNIAKRGLEYSPIGLTKAWTYDMKHLKQYMDWKKSGADPNEKPRNAVSPTEWIDKRAAGMTGTMIALLGFISARFGIARCAFDLDDPEDRLAKDNGEQQYSINFGKAANSAITSVGQLFDKGFKCELFDEDVSTSMEWAAPWCLPYFMGCAVESQIDDIDDDGTVFEKVLNGFTKIFEPMKDMSMLQSVNEMFKTNQYSKTDPFAQFLEGTFLSYATSLVPTTLARTANSLDPVKRMTFTPAGDKFPEFTRTLEQVQNKIPFLRSENALSTDMFGETDDHVMPVVIENFVSPASVSRIKNDAVREELGRLLDTTKFSEAISKTDRNKLVLSNPDKTIDLGKEGSVKLTDQQYSQLIIDRGKMADSLLQQLMSTTEYVIADDDTKANMVINVYDYATKIAKHNIDERVTLNDSNNTWIESAYKHGNPVETIIDANVQKNRKNYINFYAKAAAKSLDSGNEQDLATSMAFLQDAGATEQEIRTSISDYFRPLYYEAYEKGDEDTMEEIQDKLTDLDIGYKSSTFKGWRRNVDKKLYSDEDEDEEEDMTRWLNPNNQ